ncbi:J domain-containing protein [Paenarthrobacter sp. NPDC018779]|uniref:J domain-containing protein n=1 Tax=Paenarthrobacter sp. NPDC018779 TaxID=3364375 RepID=UPI0037C587B5
MGNEPDYYAILGVAPTASAREIARAYRALLRQHHPDTRQKTHDGGASEALDLQQLHAVMQAYVVLSDPGKRAAYDGGRTRAVGTPVSVRVHRTTAVPVPGRQQQPLSFGPTRWTPLRRTHPRRPT